MGRFEGRVALVTGAAQGIGAEFASGLAFEGAKITIADTVSGKDVVDNIIERGGDAIDVRCDVSDEKSSQLAVSATVEAYGRLDILINNAALFNNILRAHFDEITIEEWDRVCGVNVRGVWLMCKAAVPEMRKNSYGKIINISSARALRGAPGFLHYDTSKAAVLGITRSLAKEIGDDGINVNSLVLGSIASENVLKRHTEDGVTMDETIATRALKRSEHPKDLVGACLFLASNDSAFMTGQSLVVDGGGVMH